MPRGKKIVTYQLVPVEKQEKRTKQVYTVRINKGLQKDMVFSKYCPANRKHIKMKAKEIKHSN